MERMDNKDRELVSLAVENALESRPGICLLKEYVLFDRAAREMIFSSITAHVRNNPDFPKEAVLKIGSGYSYLEILNGQIYVDAMLPILKSIESPLFSHVSNSLHLSPACNIGVYAPLSPVGPHITISKGIDRNLAGNRYKFDIDTTRGLTFYYDARRGQIPSGFDGRMYVIGWYVLYVTGLPPQIAGHGNNSHISVAIMACRK